MKGLKILMIEDCETDAEMVQRLLKKEYQDVVFRLCMTEADFLHQFEQFKPDLIIADNSLPEFSATRALQLLQGLPQPVPFILVTGTVSEEFAAGIIKLGADDYILKDRLTRLPGAVESAMRQWRIKRENEIARQALVRSEENLKTIFDNASEGFILLDIAGGVKAFNKKAAQNVLFISRKNLSTGASIFDFIEVSREEYLRVVTGKVIAGEMVQYDRCYGYPENEAIWINFIFNPVWQNNGVTGVCITVRDITGAKLAAEQKETARINLQALAERMGSILNTLPANIALLDQDGIIIEVNEAWKKFAVANGFSEKNYGIGDNYIENNIVSNGQPGNDARAVADGLLAVLQKKLTEFVFEYSCQLAGVKRWFRMVATPLEQSARGGAVVMHIDISALRRLEQERLESKMDEQKKIARAMLHAQEKERNQLGQDLHDNISQLLAAIKMKMGYFIRDPENNFGVIVNCLEHIQEVIEEARKLSHRMVLPRFAENSFGQAVGQLASKYENANRKIEVKLKDLDEDAMAPGIKETLYRIAQEQLNNIEKYARADRVYININTTSTYFLMEIKDNGKGFDKKEKKNGIGLANIFNRAEAYNGTAAIEAAPGKGCVLTVALPVIK